MDESSECLRAKDCLSVGRVSFCVNRANVVPIVRYIATSFAYEPPSDKIPSNDQYLFLSALLIFRRSINVRNDLLKQIFYL